MSAHLDRAHPLTVLADPSVRLFAIDLRGTLIRTPSVTVLVPELLICGIPVQLALAVQARFNAEVRSSLADRPDVLDWTRFAAHWMADQLAPLPIDVEAVVDGFQARYVREARALIGREALRRVAELLFARCVIVADGPREREAAVLAACFGDADWLPPLISSECLGVNKLTPAFFARLSRRQGVTPSSTVVMGDRWDKDVVIPRRAGCHGVLVGSRAANGVSLDSLERLALLLDPGAGRCTIP